MWSYILEGNSTAGGYTLNQDIIDILLYFGDNPSLRRGNCSSEGAFLFGCNCRNAFYSLEGTACQSFLCNIFNYANENALELFTKVKHAKSIKDIVSAGMQFMKPYASDLCTCKDQMFGAVKQCLTKYDGMAVYEDDREEFQDFFKSMKLKKLEKVLFSMSTAYCQ